MHPVLKSREGLRVQHIPSAKKTQEVPQKPRRRGGGHLQVPVPPTPLPVACWLELDGARSHSKPCSNASYSPAPLWDYILHPGTPLQGTQALVSLGRLRKAPNAALPSISQTSAPSPKPRESAGTRCGEGGGMQQSIPRDTAWGQQQGQLGEDAARQEELQQPQLGHYLWCLAWSRRIRKGRRLPVGVISSRCRSGMTGNLPKQKKEKGRGT